MPISPKHPKSSSDADATARALPRLVTLSEASAIVSNTIKISTLRHWVAVGRITGYRPGKVLLLDADQLVALVRASAVPTTARKVA
jgi:hypothetical protein